MIGESLRILPSYGLFFRNNMWQIREKTTETFDERLRHLGKARRRRKGASSIDFWSHTSTNYRRGKYWPIIWIRVKTFFFMRKKTRLLQILKDAFLHVSFFKKPYKFCSSYSQLIYFENAIFLVIIPTTTVLKLTLRHFLGRKKSNSHLELLAQSCKLPEKTEHFNHDSSWWN